MKIMKIIELQMRITILLNIIEFQCDNEETNENLKFQYENLENHENHRIEKIIKILDFHARVTTMIEI